MIGNKPNDSDRETHGAFPGASSVALDLLFQQSIYPGAVL